MKRFSFLTFLLGFSMMFIFSNCTRVDPTEAGFKISRSGSYRGIDSLPVVTGYQWYNPFTTQIITIPTTINHIVWSEDEQEGSEKNQHITISCQGGSGFKVDVGLNFRVVHDRASRIYLKYKTDNIESITATFLRNNVRGAMQDVSGMITVDSLLNNLPGFENAVRAKLIPIFDKEGFVLDNFNILSAPRPIDPNLARSINEKIQAKQNAEKVKMEELTATAEANKQIATARGDSASAVIRAKGQAEAIQQMREYLTPTYVEWSRIQKWNGEYPTTMLGAGTNTLFSLNK